MNGIRAPFDVRQRLRASARSRAGFSLVELLVVSAIFLLVLGAVGGMLVSSTRAYTVTTARSEAIQDSESVLQLLRYEIALAGYRGLDAAATSRSFTLGGDETIIVRRTASGDEVTVRYFEDRYLTGTDTGERSVTFSVDAASQALVRQETRPGGGASSTELLVGNILSMEVVEIVDRLRDRFPIGDILDLSVEPPDVMAGLNIHVHLADGLEWQFLVGVSNPQRYLVTSD